MSGDFVDNTLSPSNLEPSYTINDFILIYLFPLSSTRGRQEEPITLSSDDEMGSNPETTVLEGDSEVQVR